MPRSGVPPVVIPDLETHRRALYKFAMMQLRNETYAEDCVQEALAAAVQSADRFAGNSSVRTWLIGILKHKILDHFRRASREEAMAPTEEELALDDFDVLYKEDGHRAEAPCAWANPEQALTQREFFEVLERCMEGLPKNTARVFEMREVMGLAIDEICAELSITPTNCSVMIYRARMSLRECLDQRWFGVQNMRAAR
jgi:RNA polymerase sigma-70 factor (ECF subfamily)